MLLSLCSLELLGNHAVHSSLCKITAIKRCFEASMKGRFLFISCDHTVQLLPLVALDVCCWANFDVHAAVILWCVYVILFSEMLVCLVFFILCFSCRSHFGPV